MFTLSLAGGPRRYQLPSSFILTIKYRPTDSNQNLACDRWQNILNACQGVRSSVLYHKSVILPVLVHRILEIGI